VPLRWPLIEIFNLQTFLIWNEFFVDLQKQVVLTVLQCNYYYEFMKNKNAVVSQLFWSKVSYDITYVNSVEVQLRQWQCKICSEFLLAVYVSTLGCVSVVNVIELWAYKAHEGSQWIPLCRRVGDEQGWTSDVADYCCIELECVKMNSRRLSCVIAHEHVAVFCLQLCCVDTRGMSSELRLAEHVYGKWCSSHLLTPFVSCDKDAAWFDSCRADTAHWVLWWLRSNYVCQ